MQAIPDAAIIQISAHHIGIQISEYFNVRRPQPRAVAVRIEAEHLDPARRLPPQSEHEAHEGGLAGAVRADEAGDAVRHLDILRRRNCAFCLADTEEAEAPRVRTADWGYLRLRRESYEPERLASWIDWAKSGDWSEAFAFFKHEDAGAGPRLARRAIELAAG